MKNYVWVLLIYEGVLSNGTEWPWQGKEFPTRKAAVIYLQNTDFIDGRIIKMKKFNGRKPNA